MFFGVAAFRLQNTTVPTVLAPILLTATGVVTVLDDLLAIALSTSIYNQFDDHAYTILYITSFSPLPNICHWAGCLFFHPLNSPYAG